MTDTIAFEWLKLSKRWMPRVVLVLLLGLTILAFWGYGSRPERRPDLFLPRGWLAALTFCSFFAPFFWPVLGGSWAGNEYGWGTIRAILTRRPDRIMHVVSALVVLVIGVLIGIVAIVLVASVASEVVSLSTGNPGWTAGVFTGSFAGIFLKGLLTAWYVSSFYLLLAYTAAVATRSTAVGIGFGIGSTLAEVVLTGLFRSLGGVWNDIAQHFPFRYTQDLITQVVGPGLSPGSGLADVGPNTPSAADSFLAVAIYSAVLIAAMLIAVRSRDITA